MDIYIPHDNGYTKHVVDCGEKVAPQQRLVEFGHDVLRRPMSVDYCWYNYPEGDPIVIAKPLHDGSENALRSRSYYELRQAPTNLIEATDCSICNPESEVQ